MMRVHSKILISIILLTLFTAANVEALETGTIKPYVGKTYFDVRYVIYEGLQEIHFHNLFGDRGVIAFHDIFKLFDENGNDITSSIRPHLVRPRNLFDNPIEDPDDLSLVKPRLILGLSYSRMNGDFLIDINDEKLSDGSVTTTGLNVGVLFQLYKFADLISLCWKKG